MTNIVLSGLHSQNNEDKQRRNAKNKDSIHFWGEFWVTLKLIAKIETAHNDITTSKIDWPAVPELMMSYQQGNNEIIFN